MPKQGGILNQEANIYCQLGGLELNRTIQNVLQVSSMTKSLVQYTRT